MNRVSLVLLVSVCFILAACGGAESRKAKYLQNAQSHYDNDACAKAKLDYRNVLQIDPKDAVSRIGLARCLSEEQEWRSVFKLLTAVIEDYPTNVDAMHELAKLYLISGDREKTYELIEEILVINPEHASTIALRGLFHTANQTIVAARSDADEALSIDSQNLLAVSLMSALKLKDKEYDDAIELVQNAISNTTDNDRKVKELKVLLIAIYARTNEIDKIIPVYESLIEKYPNKVHYKNRLAVVYAEQGEYAKGEELLLNSGNSNDENYKTLLSHVAFVNKYQGDEKGLETLAEYAKQNDSHPRIKLALGERYFHNNDIENARAVFIPLSQDKVSTLESNEAKNYLAYLALKDKKVDEALNLVDEVLLENPTNQRSLIIRGSVALSRRDAPQAIADFQTVLRDQPSNTRIIRQLASAYVLNGQQDLAKDLVQRAVEIDSDSKELNLLYARLQGQDQEFDSAISIVNELIDSDDQDVESIKTLFDLQVANNDLDGAKETTDQIKHASEDSPLGYYLAGVLSQNEKDFPAAEKEYLTALDKNSRASEPLSALIKLYLGQNQVDKALEYLESLIKNDPDYLVPYNLQAEIYLSQKNYSAANLRFEDAITRNNKWWVPYRGLSLMYAAQGDMDNSLDTLQRGMNNGADIERLGIDLALAQMRLERRQDAINTYQAILSELPNSVLAKNNISMLLVDDTASEEEINQAVSYINSIGNIKDAALLDTAGWVYYRSGDVDKAIDYLSRALKITPENAEMNYHMGMIYAEKGDFVRAKEHLNKAVNTEQNYFGKEEAEKKLNELQ